MNTSPTEIASRNGSASAFVLVDRFLHSSLYNDASLLFRARVLIASLYAIIFFSALSILFMALVPVPDVTRQVGIPVCGIFVATCTPLLFRLRRDGAFHFCARFTVWLLFAPIVFGVFITGGMTTSPVAHMVMGPPLLMAFFLGGMRFGLTVVAAAATVIAAGLLFEGNVMPALQVFTPEQFGGAKIVFALEAIFANAMLAFLYEYVSGVVRKARDQEHRKIVTLAQTDALTGLANRRVFDEALAQRIALYRTDRQSQPFALCYLDLNGFKPINDRHGHDVGDQVLRAISIRLRSSLRGADLIGRQGGDEFMLLLEGLEPGPPLDIMAQRFLQIMAEPIETSAGLLSVSGSLGFALFPQHGADTTTLKAAADSAMYEAKRQKLGWCVAGAGDASRDTVVTER